MNYWGLQFAILVGCLAVGTFVCHVSPLSPQALLPGIAVGWAVVAVRGALKGGTKS